MRTETSSAATEKTTWPIVERIRRYKAGEMSRNEKHALEMWARRREKDDGSAKEGITPVEKKRLEEYRSVRKRKADETDEGFNADLLAPPPPSSNPPPPPPLETVEVEAATSEEKTSVESGAPPPPPPPPPTGAGPGMPTVDGMTGATPVTAGAAAQAYIAWLKKMQVVIASEGLFAMPDEILDGIVRIAAERVAAKYINDDWLNSDGACLVVAVAPAGLTVVQGVRVARKRGELGGKRPQPKPVAGEATAQPPRHPAQPAPPTAEGTFEGGEVGGEEFGGGDGQSDVRFV